MTEDRSSQQNNQDIESTVDTTGAINISQTNVDDLHAELVRANQSNITHLTATEVEVRMGIVLDAAAENINAHQSFVGMAHGDTVQTNQSNALLVNATETSMVNSMSLAVCSPSVTLSESNVNLLVARGVSGGNIHSKILIAGRVDGPVETTIDTPRAAIAGLLAGAVIGMVLVAGKYLFQKSN